MAKTAISRQEQGLAIANISGTVKRINELKYVESLSLISSQPTLT